MQTQINSFPSHQSYRRYYYLSCIQTTFQPHGVVFELSMIFGHMQPNRSSPLLNALVVTKNVVNLSTTTNTTSLSCFSHLSHLSASTLRSVSVRIKTRQRRRSSAISVVIWFLAISSFTRSRHLSFGLPRFLFPSTSICYIFLVASSLSLLCTCPNHLSLFSLRNSAIGYMCVSFQMSTSLSCISCNTTVSYLCRQTTCCLALIAIYIYIYSGIIVCYWNKSNNVKNVEKIAKQL